MSNLTDALIAAKLIGGGGSGGGSGLPEITPSTLTPVVSEDTFAFSEDELNAGNYATSLTLTMEIGTEYNVKWDGTNYKVTASRQGPMIYMGNPAMIGGPDSGEPFIIVTMGPSTYASTKSSAASHTIGIYTGDPQTPADGSVMIVQNGAWVAASLEDLVNAIVNP